MDPQCLEGEKRKGVYLMAPSCLPFSGWSQLTHRLWNPLYFWVYYVADLGRARSLTSWRGAPLVSQSGGRVRVSGLLSALTWIPELLGSWMQACWCWHPAEEEGTGLHSWEAEITKVFEEGASWHHSSWCSPFELVGFSGGMGMTDSWPVQKLGWTWLGNRFSRKNRLNSVSLTAGTPRYVLNYSCRLPAKPATSNYYFYVTS